MEKPSILNVFHKEYSNKSTNMVDILIDIRAILNQKLEWLPGAQHLMESLSARPEDTHIIVYNNAGHGVSDLTKIFRKARVFCDIESDPIYLYNIDILISPISGINYVDFPSITEFLEKL